MTNVESLCNIMLGVRILLAAIFLGTALGRQYNVAIIETNATDGIPFGIPKSGAAMDIAREDIMVRYSHTLDIKITRTAAATGASEVLAVLAELYHTHTIDAIIGLGFSTSIQACGSLIAIWNIPIITPGGSANYLNSKKLYPTLTRMIPVTTATYSALTLKFLNLFSWKHLAIIKDRKHVSNLQWDTLKSYLNRAGHTYHYNVFELDSTKEEELEWALTEANKNARVFILLAKLSTARALMLTAHRLGYTDGEHVMLLISTLDTIANESIWKQGDKHDETAKKAFESCLVFTMKQTHHDAGYQAFEAEVKKRSLRDYGYNYGAERVHMMVVAYYDSLMIFAQVLNETIADGGDLKNGTAFAHRLWNRTYKGIAGDVVLTSNGSRYSPLAVHDLDSDSGKFKKIGEYIPDRDDLMPIPSVKIHWPGTGSPPRDVPRCGFLNNKCYANSGVNKSVVAGLGIVCAILMITAAVIVFTQIRKWRAKHEAHRRQCRCYPKPGE